MIHVKFHSKTCWWWWCRKSQKKNFFLYGKNFKKIAIISKKGKWTCYLVQKIEHVIYYIFPCFHQHRTTLLREVSKISVIFMIMRVKPARQRSVIVHRCNDHRSSLTIIVNQSDCLTMIVNDSRCNDHRSKIWISYVVERSSLPIKFLNDDR